eukprot:scaffold587_cov171-Amphora_coffeaeformis.AAC.12
MESSRRLHRRQATENYLPSADRHPRSTRRRYDFGLGRARLRPCGSVSRSSFFRVPAAAIKQSRLRGSQNAVWYHVWAVGPDNNNVITSRQNRDGVSIEPSAETLAIINFLFRLYVIHRYRTLCASVFIAVFFVCPYVRKTPIAVFFVCPYVRKTLIAVFFVCPYVRKPIEVFFVCTSPAERFRMSILARCAAAAMLKLALSRTMFRDCWLRKSTGYLSTNDVMVASTCSNLCTMGCKQWYGTSSFYYYSTTTISSSSWEMTTTYLLPF